MTRLTGVTETPIVSVAPKSGDEKSDSKVKSSEERGGTLAVMATAGETTGDHFQQTLSASVHQGTAMESLPSKREDSGSPNSDQRASRHKLEEEEDGIDPVMLKYMQLVKEKRQDKDSQVLPACMCIL